MSGRMISTRLLVVSLLVAATAGYSRSVLSADAIPRAVDLHALPLALGGWHGVEQGPLDAETRRILQADSYILRSYTRGASNVGLYVAYYATERAGHTMHSPLNCLPGSGWDPVERRRESVAVAPNLVFDVNRVVVQKGAAQQIVYYWYQSRGRAVASEYRSKLLLVRDSLMLHRSDGAIVRVNAPIAGGEQASAADATSFIHTLYPSLTRQIPE
jgi:EpsI family protein